MKSPKYISLAEFEEHMEKPSTCATSDDHVEEYKRQFYTYIFGGGILIFLCGLAIFLTLVYSIVNL